MDEHPLHPPPSLRITDLIETGGDDPRSVENEEDREDGAGDERDAARRRRLERLRGRPAGEPVRNVVDEVLHPPSQVNLTQEVRILLELGGAFGRGILQAVGGLAHVVDDPVADEADGAQTRDHEEQHHDARGSHRDPNSTAGYTSTAIAPATSTQAITRSE